MQCGFSSFNDLFLAFQVENKLQSTDLIVNVEGPIPVPLGEGPVVEGEYLTLESYIY